MQVGRIFCFQPTYGAGIASSHRAFMCGTFVPSDTLCGRIDFAQMGGSLLANTFNQAWVRALNMQREGRDITHFAMLHDDVVPADGWLRTLLEDLRNTGADLVSAVIPIKDSRGVTSTAIDDPEDEFQVHRRLTMYEIVRLPKVFSAADLGCPDRKLLVNTGCWCCRFNRPWRYYPHFQIMDRIIFRLKDPETARQEGKWWAQHLFGRGRNKLSQNQAAGLATNNELPPGEWAAEVDSEDWNFSRQVQEQGARVVATSRVELIHQGGFPWPNNQEWGEYEWDENTLGKDVKSVTRLYVGNGSTSNQPQLTAAISSDYTPSKEFPGVDGWMPDEDGQALARLAEGKDVLEIGAYKGLSTLWLAKTARHVTTIDTFISTDTERAEGTDTLAAFRSNLGAYGASQKVAYYQNRSDVVLLGLAKNSFMYDVVFIDGAHDAHSVKQDVLALDPLMRPGGLLVFHDYRAGNPETGELSKASRGVTEVVDLMLANGAKLVERVGTLAVILPPYRSTDKQPKEESNNGDVQREERQAEQGVFESSALEHASAAHLPHTGRDPSRAYDPDPSI